MKQLFTIITFISIALCSCTSTYVTIQNPQELKGKKLGIAYFNLTENTRKKTSQPADTICNCISEFIVNNLTPHLQQAGMSVVSLSELKKTELSTIFEKADSLKVDHVLFGSGIVYPSSKKTNYSIFSFTVKMINVQSREIVMTGEAHFFLNQKKPIDRLGKRIIALMK